MAGVLLARLVYWQSIGNLTGSDDTNGKLPLGKLEKRDRLSQTDILRQPLSRHVRRRLLCLAIALSGAFVLGGLWPFDWRPPRWVTNSATFTGTLAFPQEGIAYTPTAPAWVDRAIQSNQLRIELRLRSFSSRQPNTARILTLSRDPAARNLTLGQDGSDLVLRLRRGRLYNGLPDYRVASVFESRDWHDIDIRITASEVTIQLDGEIVLTEPLEKEPLAHWNRSFRITLGNEFSGNRPWLGEIARAVVHVGTDSFDQLLPDELMMPKTFVDGRPRDFLYPLSDSVHRRDAALDLPLNFFIFAPIGLLFAASLSWRPTLTAIVICFLLSLSVEFGQLFLEHRMTSGVDLLLNTIGGAAGAIAATRLLGTPRRP